jgi:hypothetical protein
MPTLANTLPAHVAKQLVAGLEYAKIKTADDKVATTVEVGAPQVTPDNSPIGGQVAVTQGAPVEESLVFIIDTSAYDEDEEVVAYHGDASETHELSCDTCSADENKASVILGSASCNRYPGFLNRLCSTPYTFANFTIKAQKTAGAGAGTTIDLPEEILVTRKNLNDEGPIIRVPVAQFEKLEAFPRPDLKYADIALTNSANLFDRDTRWRIPNLVGKHNYTVTVYTAFHKEERKSAGLDKG